MAVRLSTGHATAICNVGIRMAYQNAVLVVYGGASLPSDLNNAITATPLVVITKDGGEFTGGGSTNGLNFAAAVNGQIVKDATEIWKGTVLPAAGEDGTTATFWVLYANAYDTSESTTAIRMAGQISTSPLAEMPIADPLLIAGTPFVVSDFTYKPKRS